ncbi:MAG: NAD-dependent deacylase [Bacteriovoracaceae bacterium]
MFHFNPKNIRNIVILTGAGISAESGIQTFRASDGLWENHRIEDVATPEGFRKNPKLVYEFYNERRKKLLSPDVSPNIAHTSLAHLEREFAGTVTIITQNVDDLHERAGSKNIIHMHGELLKMRCQKTQIVYQIKENFDSDTKCLCCDRKGTLRPHIVWFNEIPFALDQIDLELSHANLFISIGTSGKVYPAAQFVSMAKQRNQSYCIEINPTSTDIEHSFDELHRELASLTVPKLVKFLLTK